MKKYLFLVATAWLLINCKETATDPDSSMSDKAQAFAEAYFNYDYQEAVKHVTPESERWLRFAASNITQEDIDAVNAQPMAASVETEEVDWENDTTASVTVVVRDFIQKDSIGKPGRPCAEGRFRLTVVTRNGNPSVRMACPLRSEKQSLD